jgi:hypothetical protein
MGGSFHSDVNVDQRVETIGNHSDFTSITWGIDDF